MCFLKRHHLNLVFLWNVNFILSATLPEKTPSLQKELEPGVRASSLSVMNSISNVCESIKKEEVHICVCKKENVSELKILILFIVFQFQFILGIKP